MVNTQLVMFEMLKDTCRRLEGSAGFRINVGLVPQVTKLGGDEWGSGGWGIRKKEA